MDDKLPKTTSSTNSVKETPLDPNVAFQQWLTTNQYAFSIEALPQDNPLLEGKGFVLTEKPLLVLTIKKKEAV